jgi:K+-transporting ATPase ATPase C chain
MISLLRPALVLFVLLTAITGIAYPFATTGVAQLAFAHAANGSLVMRDGKPVGSELIGQNFDMPRYFQGRPSATSPMAYNAAASGGSNLGPSNPALADAVKQRVAALHDANPDASGEIPADLVMASASGLTPISRRRPRFGSYRASPRHAGFRSRTSKLWSRRTRRSLRWACLARRMSTCLR